MNITQFEQSGFILETKSGYRLAVDIGSYTPFEKLENVSADAMMISHLHKDHFFVEHIQKLSPQKVYLSKECIDALQGEDLSAEIIEIKNGDVLDIENIKVTVFEVDHGPNVSVAPKENFGFLFDADGERLYFAGDMFYSSGIDVSSLEVDHALIPVGGFYTFGPVEAVEFVRQFKKIGKIIPMHYDKTPETKGEFEVLVNIF
jgi:L-ascorbate metabolism protein UlaG (beta-lactamase superfamily)